MKAAVALLKRLISDPLWLVSFRNISIYLGSDGVHVRMRLYVLVLPVSYLAMDAAYSY